MGIRSDDDEEFAHPSDEDYAKNLEHARRHSELHAALDELVADWIQQTRKRPSSSTVLELMQWANAQRLCPDHPR